MLHFHFTPNMASKNPCARNSLFYLLLTMIIVRSLHIKSYNTKFSSICFLNLLNIKTTISNECPLFGDKYFSYDSEILFEDLILFKPCDV